MKKFSIVILTFLFTIAAIGQEKIYSTKSGSISINANTPLETIEATNNQTLSKLSDKSGQLVFMLLIKGFTFKNALMQEHFNENYMESAKFPQAKFRGKINEKIDYTKAGENKVTCTGDLTIHGVTKATTITGTIKVVDGKLVLDSKFSVKLKDFNIEVPKLVFQNIAEDIQVTMTSTYSPYVKK